MRLLGSCHRARHATEAPAAAREESERAEERHGDEPARVVCVAADAQGEEEEAYLREGRGGVISDQEGQVRQRKVR